MPKDKGRPPYFLFDPAAWNGSPKVRVMEPDQIAWFIQLLADAWESKDTPQATLPNDDIKLKQMSRYNKSIDRERKRFTNIRAHLITALTSLNHQPTANETISILTQVLGVALEEAENELESQWQRVKDQFSVDRTLIYSPRQMAELRRWRDSLLRRASVGVEAAGKRWGKPLSEVTKEFMDIEGNLQHPILDGTAITNPSVISDNVLTQTIPILSARSPLTSTWPTHTLNNNLNEKDVSKNDTSKKIGDPLSNNQESKVKTPRKGVETLFNEEKFALTDKMKKYLGDKYPEFVQGDIDYMVEKFKLLYHGKVYTSWSRTFYNFVSNQLVMYGYKPGQFQWRKIEGSKTSSTPYPQAVNEPAVERNARLERENDEYTQRLLQSSNSSDNSEDSEALPLTADDVRES